MLYRVQFQIQINRNLYIVVIWQPWKYKVFCTWEFRITSICMNKYTTQRKMFKLSIIQVCIRYKMGQLTAEQRIFKRLWLINLNLKGCTFFWYTLYITFGISPVEFNLYHVNTKAEEIVEKCCIYCFDFVYMLKIIGLAY